MDLDLEQIVVLTVTAIAVAPLFWVERRSRRNRAAAAQKPIDPSQ